MDARLDALQLDINPLESALATGYKVSGLVGHEFLPTYRVPGRTVKAPIYGTEGFELVNAERALHTDPKEIAFSVSYQEVALTEYTLQMPVDVREDEAAAVAGISMESRARMTCQRSVAISREYAISQMLATTTNYASGNSTTVTNQWADKTSGVSDNDPMTEIEAGVDVIRTKTGLKPNYGLMGYDTWMAFKGNTYILDRMPGGTGADRTVKNVTVDMAREILGLDRLFIAESIYHTGSAFADIWSDLMVLAYCNPNPTDVEEPTFGFTLAQQYGEIDGVPLLGVSGSWQKSPWVRGVWYGEMRKPWIALNTAGYLMLDCV